MANRELRIILDLIIVANIYNMPILLAKTVNHSR